MMSTLIDLAKEDVKRSNQMYDWYHFFRLHMKENALTSQDMEAYKNAFNAELQRVFDATFRPAREVALALDQPVFLQELDEDKRKYQNHSLTVRAPQTGLIRVLNGHLSAKNYPLGNHHFALRIRNNDRRLPKDPQLVVILYASEGPRFFAPQWLSDLYLKVLDQLITVDRSFPLGAIIPYGGRTYRVIRTDTISAREAADLEESFDIFGAAGDYSQLELIENPPVHITLTGHLSRHVDLEIWQKLKPFMQYRDAKTIEDIGGSHPGWYVTNEQAVEDILLLTVDWRVATRRRYTMEDQREVEARERREEEERFQRIEQKQKDYGEWKNHLLQGLESFHAWFEGFPRLSWQEIARFDKEAGWFDTGDRWSQSTWNGQIIYSRAYGNTTVYYSTHENVVKLARMCIEWWRTFYPTDIDIARKILMCHDQGCIGDDPARIVVEEDGIQTYIDIARQEVWYIIAQDHKLDKYWKTADKYGLPYVELTRRTHIYAKQVTHATREAFKQRMKDFFQKGYYTDIYYLPEEKKWFVSEAGSSAPAIAAMDLSDLFPELVQS